jgi:glycosyltransferase involved in cell wall biosynthesis
LFKIEEEHIKNYDLTTFVNKDESSYWKIYGNSITLPHGIDNSFFKFRQKKEEYKNIISFIGRMDYQPNIDAVLWFCKNVLPNLNKSIILYIIGGFPTKEIVQLQNQNIHVLGFVDDPYEILSSCICTVAPMRSGGGLQTKVLLAMAVNSIVLSSSLAANPIDGAKNNQNILIEDDPVKIANIINDISLNPNKYLDLANAGSNLVKSTYSLDVIEDKLLQIVENILK